ncbi:MAG: DUF4058 family protein [Planctomycetia bacterium]|nr:DUF4058 family protein [Planctomycetia bacterium]
MPLRDHFRPPVDTVVSWEGLHGQWPATIVQHLRRALPPGYTAAPRVHSGSQIEIDVAAYEKEDVPRNAEPSNGNGGATTATWTATAPTLTVETTLPDYDEYEVRVYDATRRNYLVAAIEIVSPANKDRLEKRNAFIGKCAALLQKGVAVSLVDLVTTRHFNLYTELLNFIGHSDPTMTAEPPHLYAASCRWVKKEKRTLLETWSHTLTIGQTLPTLPLWLTEEKVVPLDLEQSYEQACRDLWIA